MKGIKMALAYLWKSFGAFPKNKSLSSLFLMCVGLYQAHAIPKNFVFLKDIDPTIIESPRYHTKENFLGRPVAGYVSSRIICTKEAAEKLKRVHEDLKKTGYKLVVYDGYRPQRAVNDFIQWGQNEADQTAKASYYPTTNKKDVFQLGYVAEQSSHSRGSTFDLTLISSEHSLKPISYAQRQLVTGEAIPFLDDNTVDMSSSFDLFHEVSHHDSPLIPESCTQRRDLLRETMKKHGFKEYKQEWWHYTLEDEPYPDTYFDFLASD